jgi:hypothetical protein
VVVEVRVALHIKTLSRISWLAACGNAPQCPNAAGRYVQNKKEKIVFVCITFYFYLN